MNTEELIKYHLKKAEELAFNYNLPEVVCEEIKKYMDDIDLVLNEFYEAEAKKIEEAVDVDSNWHWN